MQKSLGVLSSLIAIFLTGCQTLQKESDSDVFSKIVEAHQTFGASPKDWPDHEFRTQQINPVVFVVPLFSPRYLAPFAKKVTPVAKGRFPVYDVETKEGGHVSFIQIGVGACNVLDAVLALAATPCRRLLFIGSVGSLVKEANIGDLIVPSESVSGCGADLYLTTKPLFASPCLGKSYQADAASQSKLLNLAQQEAEQRVKVHDLKVVSVETVIGEYHHLEDIRKLGCEAIEMETATFFHAAKVIGRQAAALLYVVDCTFQGESLYAGRGPEVIAKKKWVKETLVPKIALKFASEAS